MDGQIGSTSGASLAKKLRNYPGKWKLIRHLIFLLEGIENKTPIISLSGDSIEKQMEEYKNVYISDFLRKPITKAKLEYSVNEALHNA
jgi:CheY-like chemotaxis protein